MVLKDCWLVKCGAEAATGKRKAVTELGKSWGWQVQEVYLRAPLVVGQVCGVTLNDLCQLHH